MAADLSELVLGVLGPLMAQAAGAIVALFLMVNLVDVVRRVFTFRE